MILSKKKLFVILVLIVTSLIMFKLLNKTYNGPIYLDDPIQNDIPDKDILYTTKDGDVVGITLMASYEANCCVKGTKNYYSDGASVVSPKDFILAWGMLNKKDVDKQIRYSQSNRWYFYRYSNDTLVSGDYISKHSANTHIIPADEEILKKIKKIKKNDYIHIEGYLALVHFNNGEWKSSLTRNDTGNGSCEILYVTDVW